MVAIVVAVSFGARADAIQLTQPIINALTPIDSLPSNKQITDVFDGNEQAALTSLQMIALDEGGVDFGIRLRAVRALTHYCNPTPCSAADPAHQTLATLATTPRYRDARSGSDLLVLRAAIESLGILRIPADADVLIPQLQHPSRDIRAATAHALRDLGNTQAIVPLRVRYATEQVQQVKIAISDALRVLGQPI